MVYIVFRHRLTINFLNRQSYLVRTQTVEIQQKSCLINRNYRKCNYFIKKTVEIFLNVH